MWDNDDDLWGDNEIDHSGSAPVDDALDELDENVAGS